MHLSSLFGNIQTAFIGMDIQAVPPWETPCVCLKHTRVRTHAHTEPGFTALYISPTQTSTVNWCRGKPRDRKDDPKHVCTVLSWEQHPAFRHPIDRKGGKICQVNLSSSGDNHSFSL